MSKLTIRDFSQGWVPSDSKVNGRPNGLLAMDNVELDENGQLTLVGGTSKIGSTFSPRALHTIDSVYVGGAKHRYEFDTTGDFYRDGVNLGSGGSTSVACVGTAYGYAIFFSGAFRKKDTGSTITNLYVPTPTVAPTITPVAPNSVSLSLDFDDAALIYGEGTFVASTPTQFNFDTDATTFRGTVENLTGYPVDALAFSVGTATENDIIAFSFQCEKPQSLVSCRLEILLDTPSAPGEAVDNYYYYQWDNVTDPVSGLNPFNQGFNSYSILQTTRGKMSRAGTDPVSSWQSVKGYRFTAQATEEISVAVFITAISGGTQAVLQGNYEWCQVSVERNGSYINKSVIGPITSQLYIPKSHVTVTPQNPTVISAPANEAWIFRRGGRLGGTFYLVAIRTVATGWSAFADTVSDEIALKQGVTVNEFMRSLDPTVTVDDILDVCGPIFGRQIYLTIYGLLVSEINSPGTYDVRRIIRLSGDTAEKALWVCKVSENTVMVGTTKDVYAISGTWQDLPDGVLDAYIRPLGTSEPPLTRDVAVNVGRVCYLAKIGWVQFSPSGEVELLTSPNVDRLYRGQDCYGYSATNIAPFSSIRYSCCVARNKLFVINPTVNGSRRLDVWDFTRKYWAPRYLAPTLLCAEEDGNIIAYFSDDGFLRNIDLQSSKLLDGTTGQRVNLLWTVRDGGDPARRNDTYTLKAKINTGNQTCQFFAYVDDNAGVTLLPTFSCSLLQEKVVDVSAELGVTKTWQFGLSITATSEFVLNWVDLEFDPRPRQLTHLRIPATNYGAMGRKRLPTIPFTIDTLNSNVEFIPYIDNVAQTALTVTSTYPKTFEYIFTSDYYGEDIEIVVDSPTGNVFEMFPMVEPRNLQVFPEPTKILVLPVTNLGTNSLKRISSWSFVINPRGNTVVINCTLDGVANTPQSFTGSEKKTVTYQFSANETFIDIFWSFTTLSGIFEYYANESNAIKPQISEIVGNPVKQWSMGPNEFFRLGKIKAIEFYIRASSTSLPVELYLDDASAITIPTITTVANADKTYMVSMPKTTKGQIARLILGNSSTSVFIVRRVRFLIQQSGGDTDGRWITWGKNG